MLLVEVVVGSIDDGSLDINKRWYAALVYRGIEIV